MKHSQCIVVDRDCTKLHELQKLLIVSNVRYMSMSATVNATRRKFLNDLLLDIYKVYLRYMQTSILIIKLGLQLSRVT